MKQDYIIQEVNVQMKMPFGGKSDMRFGHNALPHIPIMYNPNDIPKNTRLVVAVDKHLKSLADEAIKGIAQEEN